MNILPSLCPCAIIWPSSSMKHPRCVNRTCIPWSTICPTDTRFFVIVGTCTTFMSFPFYPAWLRGTSPTCSIGCGVSSPVSTTPGCSGFSGYENHSSWILTWFDAPESTYLLRDKLNIGRIGWRSRGPDRLGPIGEAEAEYRDTDRYEGRPVRCRNREAIREDIP